jgi:hypothetical protein
VSCARDLCNVLALQRPKTLNDKYTIPFQLESRLDPKKVA